MNKLTKNGLVEIIKDINIYKKKEIIVKIEKIKKKNKFRPILIISDGTNKAKVCIVKQIYHLLDNLKKGSIIKLKDYVCSIHNEKNVIVILNFINLDEK
jgi:hypothetical protein